MKFLRKKHYDGFIMSRLFEFNPIWLFSLSGKMAGVSTALLFAHTWLEEEDKKKDKNIKQMNIVVDRANELLNELIKSS